MAEWSYSEVHYAGLTGAKGVEIRTHPLKGKGLFATRPVGKGQLVFEERAICCTQCLDEFNAGIPVCAHCLKSLETPADILYRVAGPHLAAQMPFVPGFAPRQRVRCRLNQSGAECTALYCSEHCEATAWTRYHSLLCIDALRPEGKEALRRFLQCPWKHGLIDFTDTHFIALRAVAIALGAHRSSGEPLASAFSFVEQLARAPLQKFRLTCLLDRVYDEAMGLDPVHPASATPDSILDAERYRRWSRFREFQYSCPQSSPVDCWSLNSGTTTSSDLVELAMELLSSIFDLSLEEQSYFTRERWSETVGAALMNAHRRLPNTHCSPYAEYVSYAKLAGAASSISKFHRMLKANDIDPRAFDAFSHGLAIFPVGACMNHSCTPNVRVSHDKHSDETLCLEALRDIDAGEELFISYIEECDHVFLRQQYLSEQYLFSCDCERCRHELVSEEKRMLTQYSFVQKTVTAAVSPNSILF